MEQFIKWPVVTIYTFYDKTLQETGKNVNEILYLLLGGACVKCGCLR